MNHGVSPFTRIKISGGVCSEEAAGMDLATQGGEDGWGGFRDLLLLGFGAVLGAAAGWESLEAEAWGETARNVLV